MHMQVSSTDADASVGAVIGREWAPVTDWHKSARSGAQGNCVELARPSTGNVLVRNSRFPDGPVLSFSAEEMAGFVSAVKAGDFDELIADGV